MAHSNAPIGGDQNDLLEIYIGAIIKFNQEIEVLPLKCGKWKIGKWKSEKWKLRCTKLLKAEIGGQIKYKLWVNNPPLVVCGTSYVMLIQYSLVHTT